MALVVNTNIASMNAQRSLAANTVDMKTAMERLSTGKKINSAADDAAGFAIAETMTAQVRGLNMAAKNASDALGLLKVIENATNDVTDMLQRVRELAVQAKSNTNGSNDIARLQQEADALFKEISRVSKDTTYNNVAYLGAGATTSLNIQVGYNDGDVITLQTYNVASSSLGSDTKKLETITAGTKQVDTVTVGTLSSYNGSGGALDITDGGGNSIQVDYSGGAPADIDALLTNIQAASGYGDLGFTVAKASSTTLSFTWKTVGVQSNTATYVSAGASDESIAAHSTDGTADSSAYLNISSSEALDTLTKAIDQVATYKAQWGAGQNRLEYTVSNLMNVVEFTAAARSRIQDADFAIEAANLAKAQVLQQTGTAMLAQANAAPQLALQLLK